MERTSRTTPSASHSTQRTTPGGGGNPENARPRKKKSKKTNPWAKYGLILGLLVGSLVFGMIAGYAIIGGRSMGEVFSFGTWKHLFDLVFS